MWKFSFGEFLIYFIVCLCRSHSPAGDSRDATLEYYRSITSTMEETEQIHSAYKKVLNE